MPTLDTRPLWAFRLKGAAGPPLCNDGVTYLGYRVTWNGGTSNLGWTGPNKWEYHDYTASGPSWTATGPGELVMDSAGGIFGAYLTHTTDVVLTGKPSAWAITASFQIQDGLSWEQTHGNSDQILTFIGTSTDTSGVLTFHGTVNDGINPPIVATATATPICYAHCMNYMVCPDAPLSISGGMTATIEAPLWPDYDGQTINLSAGGTFQQYWDLGFGNDGFYNKIKLPLGGPYSPASRRSFVGTLKGPILVTRGFNVLEADSNGNFTIPYTTGYLTSQINILVELWCDLTGQYGTNMACRLSVVRDGRFSPGSDSASGYPDFSGRYTSYYSLDSYMGAVFQTCAPPLVGIAIGWLGPLNATPGTFQEYPPFSWGGLKVDEPETVTDYYGPITLHLRG